MCDPALPAWITPDLIAQTRAVWQPYYPQPLTDDDAVEMLLTVGHLYRALVEMEETNNDHTHDTTSTNDHSPGGQAAPESHSSEAA
jgi:hypothetical protein